MTHGAQPESSALQTGQAGRPCEPFRETFPEIAEAYDAMGETASDAGPMDEKTCRLVKLALSVRARQRGSVRKNTRRAIEAGAAPEELLQVVALVVTSIGFAPSVAVYSWVQEVLGRTYD